MSSRLLPLLHGEGDDWNDPLGPALVAGEPRIKGGSHSRPIYHQADSVVSVSRIILPARSTWSTIDFEETMTFCDLSTEFSVTIRSATALKPLMIPSTKRVAHSISTAMTPLLVHLVTKSGPSA